jgi:hypothetical protein
MFQGRSPTLEAKGWIAVDEDASCRFSLCETPPDSVPGDGAGLHPCWAFEV